MITSIVAVVVIAAVIIAQVLIIMHWRRARYGTIANAVVLIAVIVWYGNRSFTSMVDEERESFLRRSESRNEIVTRDMTASYPPVVRRWLERSGVIGKKKAATVHLRQNGMMRTSREGRWMPFEAAQWFTTVKPGFFWTADVSAMPGMYITARDKYENGQGHMLIKAVSLFTIADARGKEIDQGSIVRYLAELCWFPSAALEPYVRWEQIDSVTAKAVMTYGGITGEGLLTFTAEGDLVSFEAKRYYDREGGATLEDWLIRVDPDGYKEFEGVRIPAKSTVTWKLKDGDFTWLKLEILNVDYK